MAKVFLDKIPATEHIETIVAGEPLGNGQWLSLGVLAEDGEAREATKATGEADAEVFLVDAPLSYDDPHFDLATYQVAKGRTGRAYHLGKGDVISVTEDLVSGAKKGDALTIGINGLGFKKADSGNGIAKVIGEEAHGFDGKVFVIAIR